MGRLKSGSKIAHFSMVNEGVSSAWITQHYNQFLDTKKVVTGGNLTTELSANLTTEDLNVLVEEDVISSIEITTIPFVADENKEVEEDLP